MSKKILILFTESNLTKYKEFINNNTVSDVKNEFSKSGYNVSSFHFYGFTDELLVYVKNFDLVFNICYGLYDANNKIDISQDEVVKWLDEHNITHTTTKYVSHRLAMDKSSYPSITKEIEGLISPKELPNTEGIIIKKPRFGSCHKGIVIYNPLEEINKNNVLDKDNFIYQEYIIGREFSIAVIPDKINKFKILSPVEIVSEREIFILGVGRGIKANYCPVIEADVLKNINNTMIKLHEKLNLLGLTRIDLKLSKDNKLYLLDINAMPNIDKRQTFLPKMITQSNMTYNDVLRTIVEAFI